MPIYFSGLTPIGVFLVATSRASITKGGFQC